MKILKRGWAAFVAALLLLLFCLPALPVRASAAVASGSFSIEKMDVAVSLSADRTAKVTETLSVTFSGVQHGIIRDFDLTEGVRYSAISATRDGESVYTETKFDVDDMLSLYIGDTDEALETGKAYTYVINYKMAIPTRGEKGYLPLDVVGFDWYSSVKNLQVTVDLPGGLTDFIIYSGNAGAAANFCEIAAVKTGNRIVLTGELGIQQGVTLDLKFEEGVLAHSFDWSVLYVCLAALVLAGVFLLLKFLFARQPLLTKTVNFTAPGEMDPLLMGTRLDGTADAEDLGALVFWFASEGYLTIDLSDEDDPVLIKTEKELPEDAPAHQKMFLAGLFKEGETVRMSQLKNTFYSTADSVKIVARESEARYETRGTTLMIVFGALTVLLLGLGTWIYDMLTVGSFFFKLTPLFIALLSYWISAAICWSVEKQRFKAERYRTVLLKLFGFAVGCLPALLLFFGYSPAVSDWALLAVAILSSLAGMGAPFLVPRTKKFTEWLGQILGFKEFIRTAEKDRIETMLKEQPALYYNILPYAQVLGVSDVWTEKFEGLAMSEPDYVRYRTGDALFTALLWSHTFRMLNGTMARTFISRPPRQGGGSSGPTNSGGHFGGGFSGGFGGGHGGGGFGGGGGRSF